MHFITFVTLRIKKNISYKPLENVKLAVKRIKHWIRSWTCHMITDLAGAGVALLTDVVSLQLARCCHEQTVVARWTLTSHRSLTRTSQTCHTSCHAEISTVSAMTSGALTLKMAGRRVASQCQLLSASTRRRAKTRYWSSLHRYRSSTNDLHRHSAKWKLTRSSGLFSEAVNPLKCSGIRWLHFKVFSVIQI